MTNITENPAPANPHERPSAPVLFDDSMERINRQSIVVINPDEYTTLAGLSDEEAEDLPDGMYIVDETLRGRLQEAGVDYEDLNHAVLSGIEGGAFGSSDDKADQIIGDRLKLARQSSAHGVFFGTIRTSGEDGEPLTSIVAIKPHHESGTLSAKPFREVGNLALAKAMGYEGAYKPVGVLKHGTEKFVITELKPGIQTLDTHRWYGRLQLRNERKALTPDQLDALHSQDVELIARVIEMFGATHAQGLFHLDAQAKNVGWGTVDGEHVLSTEDTAPSRKAVTNLSGIEMTLVDYENAKIFEMQDGDFSEEYYSELAELAATDIVQFFGSVPEASRNPRGKKPNQSEPGSGYEELMAHLYLESFFDQRRLAFGEEDPARIKAMRDRLGQQLVEKMIEVNRHAGAQLNPYNDASSATPAAA